MTPKETEHLLNSFYDMPEQIAQLREEIATLYADRNASAPALSEYYREEVKAKQAQLEHIQRTYHALQSVLADLSRLDYRLAELAYLGPKDTQKRENWIRRPTWYAIAAEMGISEKQSRARASRILKRIAASWDGIFKLLAFENFINMP